MLINAVSQHSFLCHNLILRPSARPGLGAHDRHVCVARMRAQQSFQALCLDKDLCVATMFPSELGGLGHNRGLLYRDKDFPTLCHDKNYVL